MSLFLSLPVQIRFIIYGEILAPHPDEPLLLFHGDQADQQRSFHIHTAILRANRQIHTEAVQVLYGRNRFRIELLAPAVRRWPAGEYARAQTTTALQTLMYPRCFRRLRCVELVATHDALWGYDMGYHFSDAGESIVELLVVLAGGSDYVAFYNDQSLKLVDKVAWDGKTIFSGGIVDEHGNSEDEEEGGEEEAETEEEVKEATEGEAEEEEGDPGQAEEDLEQEAENTEQKQEEMEMIQKLLDLLKNLKAFRKVTVWEDLSALSGLTEGREVDIGKSAENEM